MRVRMLNTARGAVDTRGIYVATHKVGEVYDLPDHLALAYLGAIPPLAERMEQPQVSTKPGPSAVQQAGPSETKVAGEAAAPPQAASVMVNTLPEPDAAEAMRRVQLKKK